MSVPTVTVVRSASCHLCEDAREVLAEPARQSLIRVELVDADSPAGLDLVGRWRPSTFPLVLVDGAFFSQGRLSRGKLGDLLRSRTEATLR
jgi:hypothetical protein